MKSRSFRIVAVLLCLGLAGVWGPAKLVQRATENVDEAVARPQWAAPSPEPKPAADLLVLASASPSGSAGLLERELSRQALLIAARDEMGLRTRDAHLREFEFEAETAGLPPTLSANFAIRDGEARFLVYRDARGTSGTTLPVAMPRKESRIPDLVREAEALSRGRFVETLGGFGYKKAPSAGQERPERASDPAPELAGRFDLVSQYAAVRGWHAAIRSQGETPVRLAGLVRGYANLGLLTAHHWSPASKAYKARSLLYAERLVNRTGETPESLRWRAYARLLTGLPAAAGADLERAGDAAGAAPGWAAVLGARVRGDAREIDRLCDTGDLADRVLARLLRLEEAEATGSLTVVDAAARAVLDAEPACARALDSLLTKGSFAARREAQGTALDGAVAWLYEPLRVSGLPVPIDVAAARRGPEEEAKLRVKLLGELIAAGRLADDRSEPSLYGLGRLLEEEGFYQAWRVVEFDRSNLSVNADDMIARTRSWSPHHPFRLYIESLASGGAGRPRLDEAGARLKGETLVPAVWPMRDDFLVRSPGSAGEFGGETRWGGYHDYVVLENRDEIVGDLAWWIGLESTEIGCRLFTSALERVDPASAGTATRVAWHAGGRADSRLAEWEARFPRDPTLQRAVAERHADAERFRDAERCLKASAAVAPEPSTFARLSEIRLAAGDEAGALEALHGPLRQPDSGLQHANACWRIAEFYMRRGKWREALPYAERAAGSYSGWGLQCAADCREGLGDYAGAEEMMRALSERYDSAADDWYWWCLATDRGDLVEAGRVARTAVADWDRAVEGEYGADAKIKRAALDYAEGRTDAALDRLRELTGDVKLRKEAYYALFAALVADELGQADARDELLDAAVRRGVEWDPAIGVLARAFRADLDGTRLDPAAVRRDELLAVMGSGEVTNAEYFLARYLENRGRADEARPLYESAASSPQRHKVTCPLSAAAVRRLGGSVPARRLEEVHADTTRALAQYAEGNQYLGRLRYAAALRRFDNALRLLPGQVRVLESRSAALLYQDRAAEALADIEAAIAAQPGRMKLVFDRGRVLECLGRNAAAAAAYEGVLASDPSVEEAFQAHNNLCWLYAACRDESFRDPAAAMRHVGAMEFTNDIKIDNPHDWHVRARAQAVALGSAGRYEEALRWAEDALQSMQRIPESIRPVLEHQIACYKSGRPYVRPDHWWMGFDGEDSADGAPPAGREPVEAPRPQESR